MTNLTFGSLFDGIHCFGLALERVGMECAWVSETDKNCNALLKARYPHLKNLGDVKHVGKRRAHPVDLVIGGFPCQDLSVAGKRAGLAGERSGLWFQFHRVVKELRPRWVVVENVPGLFSSYSGDTPPSDLAEGDGWESVEESDFAVVLRGLDQLGYGVAWRVLDAQFFGVAQRRRRVFIVASLGSSSSFEILFEPESMSGDIAPRREAGTRVAPPLKASSPNRRNGGSDPIADEFVAYTLSVSSRGTGDGHGNAWNSNYVTGTLTKAYAGQSGNGMGEMEGGLLPAARADGTRGGGRFDPAQETYIVDCNSTPEVSEGLAMPLRADDGSGNRQVMAFAWQQGAQNQGGRDYIVRAGDYAGTLSKTRVDAIALQMNTIRDPRLNEVVGALAGKPSNTQFNGLPSTYGVRRLTPVECERLQGLPDGWTEGFKDSVRYKMLGNGGAVSVMEWIGRRIVAFKRGEL